MDDDIIPLLICDIELELSGPNTTTLNKWTAEALRKLADRIERDEFEDGHHDVEDSVGKRIGSIYMSYEGEVI